jgi:tetratricopeptide (TPR) repeat protein
MRYKKLFLFLLIQSICIFNVKAQMLDSLLKELSIHKKGDTVRLKLLNEIAEEYRYTNQKKGLETADSAIALARKLNNQREAAYGFMIKGENYDRMGQANDQAMENFEKALSSFKQLNNKKDIAFCLNVWGSSCSHMAYYPKALDYFQQAFSINKQINDKWSMGVNLGNIGNVYSQLSEYPKALEYRQQALNLNEQGGTKNAVAGALTGIDQA